MDVGLTPFPVPFSELFAEIVEHGPDGVVVVDRDGAIVFANEQASVLFGYDAATLLGLDVEALVPDTARLRHVQHRATFDASPSTRPMGVGLSLDARRADGELVPVEIALSRVLVGDAPYTIAAVRDVTEKRRLLSDVARMAHALDATNDAVVLFDATTLQIVQVNEGTTALSGYQRHELVGATPLDLGLGMDRVRLRELLEPLQRSETQSCTVISPYLRKDGRRILTEAVISRVDSPDASPIFVAVVRDVSERESAALALAEQRDHFAKLLSALQEGTIELSASGELVNVNDRFCALVARDREEVLSAERPYPWVPVDARQESAEILARALTTDSLQAELELVDRYERRFPVLVTTKRLYDDDDVPTTVFATVRDLTGEKRAMQALSDARSQLALSDDRERIARDLHDRVIQRVFGVGLTLEGMLSRVVEEPVAERLKRSIAQLDMTIREIRASIFDLERSTVVPLSQRVREIVADYERLLGFAPTCRFDGPVDTVVTPNVAEEILSVTREALSNIARHADASSTDVALSVEPNDAGAERVGTRSPVTVRLRVADNGIGVATSPSAAAGRGLANMLERAERLGGDFSLEPGPSFGTVLTWTAPLAH